MSVLMFGNRIGCAQPRWEASREAPVGVSVTTKTICEIIDRMAGSEDEKLSAHGRALQLRRVHGSTTAKSLHETEPVEFCDVTGGIPCSVWTPGYQYLQAVVPDLGARLAEVPLGKVGEYGIRTDEVKRRTGPLGPELYVEWGRRELPITTLVTVIMGRPGEYDGFPAGVVYTWHPGEPLAHMRRKDDTPHMWTGVKLSTGE